MIKRLLLTLVGLCCLALSYLTAQVDIEFNYSENSCGSIFYNFTFDDPETEILSINFGDGTQIEDTLSLDVNGYIEGYHYYSAFSTDFEICITYIIPGTDDPIADCHTVFVDGCYQEFCWLDLWLEYQECGLVSLGAYSTFSNEWDYDIAWDFGDGTYEYGYSWIEHEYTEPGTYVVCAEALNTQCPFGMFNCLTIVVEDCVEPCVEPLSYYELEECGLWEFNIGEEWSVEFAIWDFGDGTTAESYFDSVVTAQHQYTQSGTYTVCVEYFDLDCNGMQTECFTIEVETCIEPCNPEIYANELECGFWEFEVGSSNTVTDVFWSVPFANDSLNTNYIVNNITVDGTYTVCVSYYDLICQNYLTECIDIEVNCSDEESCPEISYTQLTCNEYQFMYEGNSEGFYDQWTVALNGETLLDYETLNNTGTNISFPESGLYTIGVSDAYNCDGVLTGYYLDIWIEECEEPVCPEISTEYIDCLEGGFFYEGNISGSSHCWELWQGGQMLTTYFDPSFTEMTFPGPGVYEVGVTNALNCNGEPEDYFITVIVEGCESECEEIIVESLSCDYGLFYYGGEIDYSSWSSICWEVYDENNQLLSTYLDSQLTDYNFLEAGTYFISVTNAVPCDGQIPIIEIEVPECEPECPSITTQYLECLSGGFIYQGNISGTSYCWELWQNGQMLTTYFDEMYTIIDFPEPGTYQVGVTNALDCNGNPEDYFITVVVEDCGINSCNCDLSNNLLANGSFENDTPINSGLGIDCSCQAGSVCVGSEPRDKCDNVYWINDFYDHTYGTPNGNFLIVDGGTGNVWNDQVQVTGGTTYTFSMWIAREISDNDQGNNSTQSLYTEVNGVQLSAFSTADASPQEWTEYCFDYTANYTGVANISINQDGGTGYNDWGLDDVYFGTCSSEVDCVFDPYYTQPECNVVDFWFGENVTEAFIEYGDGSYGFQENYSVHTYEEGGWYTVCAEYYNTVCEQWSYDCFDIYVEGCEIPCEPNFYISEIECGVFQIDYEDAAANVHLLAMLEGSNEFIAIAEDDNALSYTVTFTEPGTYTLSGEYYNTLCQQWLPTFTSIEVEDCDPDCENFIEAEVVECNQVIVTLPEGIDVAWVDFGDSTYVNTSEIMILHEFTEPGWYNICAEYYNTECQEGFYGCTEVYVEGCDEDCTPVLLEFNADAGNVEQFSEIIECVLETEEGVIWEGVMPFSNLLTEYGIELCLPNGCYSLSITNVDPLQLAGLSLALQSLNSDDLDLNIEIDLLGGELEASFGVGADCTVGVDDLNLTDLNIYPNPATDVVNITFSEAGWQYEVIDLMGRLIAKENTVAVQSTMNTSSWATGLYILRAERRGEVITKKFEVKH